MRYTIPTFKDNNNLPFSKVKILEAILKVMIKYEDESITDTNNVPADSFKHASSS